MKHRVAVTVSEPDHPAVSMRKETKEKFVRVTADSKDEAVAKAKAHYKKQGYKVHGAEYHSELKEELELDEAIKLNTKVRIHAPGKDYHDKVGHVGEIRHGAYKGAPKTYTVDYDGKSVQLDKKNIKLHKEEIELDEAQITHSKVAKLMGDTKTRNQAVEKVMKTFKCSREEACKHVDAVIDKTMKEEVEQIDELSMGTLTSYKKKAGEQASQANKEGDIKKADKRFSGIIKATKKQFDIATRKEEVEVSEERKSDPVPSVYSMAPESETRGTYHVEYHGTDKDGNKQTKTYKLKANTNHHAQSKAMKIARSEFPHHVRAGASTTKFFKEETQLDEAPLGVKHKVQLQYKTKDGYAAKTVVIHAPNKEAAKRYAVSDHEKRGYKEVKALRASLHEDKLSFAEFVQEASCGSKTDMIKKAVKKMREEVALEETEVVEEQVEQLEEATLAYHVKKASEAKERGDNKKFAYHMENARTARYAMTGKEMMRNRHHLDKYNELRNGK